MNQNSDSFDSLLPSKFLKQDDVETPLVLTIAGYEAGKLKDQKTGEDQPATFVLFEETDKRVVFKTWTAEALKDLFPAGKSSSIGQKVTVYRDPKVMMGGKKVGGVRFKAAGTAPF